MQENIRNFEALFSDCEDIKKRKIKVGEHFGKECYIAYIEVALSNVDWKDSAVGKFLEKLRSLPEQELTLFLFMDNIFDFHLLIYHMVAHNPDHGLLIFALQSFIDLLIREAIRMLELEGLAVTVPRKGAQVAKMTEKDLEDVLQIRRALDELAVSLACDNMTEDILEQLHEALLRCVRLTPSLAASCSSIRRSPGFNSPFNIASLSVWNTTSRKGMQRALVREM